MKELKECTITALRGYVSILQEDHPSRADVETAAEAIRALTALLHELRQPEEMW